MNNNENLKNSITKDDLAFIVSGIYKAEVTLFISQTGIKLLLSVTIFLLLCLGYQNAIFSEMFLSIALIPLVIHVAINMIYFIYYTIVLNKLP